MNFHLQSSVNRLVLLLSVSFLVVQCFLFFTTTSSEEFISWTGMPSSVDDWIKCPWTLITHFVVHISLGHLLMNVVILYTLGHWLENEKNGSYFQRVFFLGVLAGVICYFFSSIWLGFNERFLIGSSAGAMAVMGSLVAFQPKRKISFFGIIIIELLWLVIFVVLIDLIGIRQGWNVGGHLAHWGGLLTGFVIAKWNFGVNREMTHEYQIHRRPRTDDQFNDERVSREKMLNAILDKINRSGFDSLSKKEKEFLEQQSR